MVDGNEIGTRRVVEGPYVYPLDTTTLADGSHMLQLWAHDTGNNTVLSGTVQVVVANSTVFGGTGASSAPANPATPVAGTPSSAMSPVQLTYPLSGQALSGVVEVIATVSRTLDAAGSYLLIDGVEFGWRHVGSAPYLYEVDTSVLSVGQHTLQVWAHDVANETLLSNTATVLISR